MSKKVYIIIGAVLAAILVIIISFLIWYKISILAPSKNESEIIIEIESGESTLEIIDKLKEKRVIKNKLSTKMYVKLHEINSIKAGKYLFKGNEKLADVMNKIVSGQVLDETISITFLEGKNMRYIVSQIVSHTNHTSNEVYQLLKDDSYLTSLMDKYWFLTDDIKNKDIYYPLEGYLYPDTYSFENKDVKIEKIFEKMLDQTGRVLSKYRTKIEESKYSIHDFITIASIVELEGTNSDNRAKIAQVIINRLAANMSLGSDVTTYYGIKVDVGTRDLYSKEINTYNAYNTRGPNMAGKLPVGPIDNPSEESIMASINPIEGNYLYFVSDKNGEIYFSNNYEEHQNTIDLLKKKGLWFEFK